MSTSKKDIWHRPEFRDRLDEIESRTEYEERNGLKPKLISTRFRDYADRVPEVVADRWRSGLYPEKLYVSKELDDFLESIAGHNSPRKPVEVAKAEVARYERGVAEAERRVSSRKEDLAKAERYAATQKKKLKIAQERLRVEQEL